MSDYTEYIISMKSGAKFVVKIKSFEYFANELLDAAKLNAETSLYVTGGIVININDVSAVYPKEAEDKLQEKF